MAIGLWACECGVADGAVGCGTDRPTSCHGIPSGHLTNVRFLRDPSICPVLFFLTHFAVLYYFVACFDGCTISCKNQCFLGCCRFEGRRVHPMFRYNKTPPTLKSIESFEPCACSFIFILCRKVNELSLCLSRIDSSYRHRRWDKPVEHQIHSSPEFRNTLRQ